MKTKWLSKIKKTKHPEFYKELLEYMFEKFELASDEDEDVVFDMLKWDLVKMDKDIDTGVENGYSVELQLRLAKFVLEKEMKFEETTREAKDYLDEVLEQYSKGNSKSS